MGSGVCLLLSWASHTASVLLKKQEKASFRGDAHLQHDETCSGDGDLNLLELPSSSLAVPSGADSIGSNPFPVVKGEFPWLSFLSAHQVISSKKYLLMVTLSFLSQNCEHCLGGGKACPLTPPAFKQGRIWWANL